MSNKEEKVKNYRSGPYNLDYQTPKKLWDKLRAKFNFDVDLMANKDNALMLPFISPKEDTFKVSWSSYGKTGFCNPPYLKEVIEKILIRALLYAELADFTTVLVLPGNKTDQKWWNKYIWDNENNSPYPGVTLRYLQGRVPFIRSDGKPTRGTEPTVIVIIKKADKREDGRILYKTINQKSTKPEGGKR